MKAAHYHVRAEAPAYDHTLHGLLARVAERLGEMPVGITESVSRLEPLFTQTRYPSQDPDDPIPADAITEARARAALADAADVLAWVRALLRTPPGGARRAFW